MALINIISGESEMDGEMEWIKTELQSRIGIIPEIKLINAQIGYMDNQLVAYKLCPRSAAEISRIIRAAKTMKCTVRACGQISGNFIGIYGDDNMVLVDCRYLRDEPRIQLVEIPRKGVVGLTKGLKILAGTPINELLKFLVHNRIQLRQGFEFNNSESNFIGFILSGAFGNAYYDNTKGIGASLEEDVISIRIYNSEGNLREYTSKEELQFAVTNYGLMGVVYDVTLHYVPMTVSKVSDDDF